ncbi:MAG: hypothetical protein Q8P22_09390 [Chloroflexota bacterium]|nr:hypothetical protein [Chloroflexota bacterium]
MKQASDRTEPWRWAVPPKMNLPPDELRARIDIHNETIVLRIFDKGTAVVKPVSALDVAQAFFAEIPLSSGILPAQALWWASIREGREVAIWIPPKVWPVAVQLEAFKPPRRLRVPMPGLVFVCQPSRPPRVYAAKRRPTGPKAQLYHAPLFNVFQDGRTCAGTQHYSHDIGKHPWEFMASFFTHAAHVQGRSKRYPKDLVALWEELDGKRRYPLGDLVSCCKVENVAPTGATS